MSSDRIAKNVDEWSRAGYPRRHRAKLEGVGGSMLDLGVALFDRADEGQVEGAYRSLLEKGGTVFLAGPRGTGKTQFAAWLGLVLAASHGASDLELSQAYWSWPVFLEQQKATFDKPAKVGPMAVQQKLELIVLDELQEGLGTDFERSLFTRLIDHRYGEMLRTVVIANLKEDAIQETIGISAWSRLCETGAFLYCDWRPYR